MASTAAAARAQDAVDKLVRCFSHPDIVSGLKKKPKSLKPPPSVVRSVWVGLVSQATNLLATFPSRTTGAGKGGTGGETGEPPVLAPERLLNRILVFLIQPLAVYLLDT